MSYIADLAKEKMNNAFKQHLPDSLYMNHYDLASSLGSTPEAWSTYLKDPENKRFIDREIAILAESAARRALNTLGSGDQISSQQVTALKEILNKSQLIQNKSNSKEKVILTYLPRKEN